jgi:hypothetical protein
MQYTNFTGPVSTREEVRYKGEWAIIITRTEFIHGTCFDELSYEVTLNSRVIHYRSFKLDSERELGTVKNMYIKWFEMEIDKLPGK